MTGDQSGPGTTPCDPECDLPDWPHDGPCKARHYIELPGRVASWTPSVGDRVYNGWATGIVTALYPAEPTCGPTCEVQYDEASPYPGLLWAGLRTSVSPVPDVSSPARTATDRG